MTIPEPPKTADQRTDQRTDRPREQAPERASARQAIDGDLEALLSEADDLAAAIDRALAARTPREVFLDHLAERVLPLSLKDAPRGDVARRLAGYERQAVRLVREAHALQEAWERSLMRIRQLREQWRELAVRQEAIAEWLDEITAERVVLADWTRRVIAYQRRRLAYLESGALPSSKYNVQRSKKRREGDHVER